MEADFQLRKLTSCVALIEATDSIEHASDVEVDGGTRSLSCSQWDNFCLQVRDGRVEATCIIDFPFKDKGAHGLNLVGEDRLLERMYCFGSGTDVRVIMHVHTLLRWGKRGNVRPEMRADTITSVNVRHAMRMADGEYEQELDKLFLVPKSKQLAFSWRNFLDDTAQIEWSWREYPIRLPLGERPSTNLVKVYQQIQQVIELAEFVFSDGYFYESEGRDSTTLIRGEAGSEFEVFATHRKRVPPTGGVSTTATFPSVAHSLIPGKTQWSLGESLIPGQLQPHPWPNKIHILFCGANKEGRAQLSLEKEYEVIADAIQLQLGKNWTDHFHLHTFYFSRLSQLVEKLNSLSPSVLHFATHGEDYGLELFDDVAGKEELTRKIAAVNQSKRAGQPFMAVFNACNSDSLAQSLSEHVDFAIGHRGPVQDTTAIKFSRDLYSSIAASCSLGNSFKAAWVPAYTLRGLSDPDKIAFTLASAAAQTLIAGEVLPDEHTRYQERRREGVSLDRWLNQDEAKTLVVTGLPGSGKTTLAKVFVSTAALRCSRKLVIFLRSSKMMQEYVALAKKVATMVDSTLPTKQFQAMPEEELVHFVHSCLTDSLRDQWLCVIDDAPNPEDDAESAAREHIRAFPFGFGKVLITSRFSAWAEDRGGRDECIEVGSFSASEAYDRVMRDMGSEWEGLSEDVVEMVTALNLFPLAIEQAVAYCRENLSTPREFIQKMKEASGGELTGGAYRTSGGNTYVASFLEVLSLIWIQLVDYADEGDASGIHNLLRKLAFLHPDDIPIDLFDKTERRYLAVLRKFSLVSLKGLSVHAMTQDAVRDFLMGQSSSRTATMKTLISSLKAKMDIFDPHEKATHSIGALYSRHVRVLASHIQNGDKELEESDIGFLVTSSASYLDDFVCHFQAAEIMIESLLATIFRSPESDHSRLSRAELLRALASVKFRQGQYSGALETQEESLLIYERLFGREHWCVAASLLGIGAVLFVQGETSEALRKHEETLTIQERLFGRESMDIAATLVNIGLVFEEQEKFSEALAKFEEGLTIKETLIGREHMEIAATLSNIGVVLRKQGRYSEALAKYEESLGISERLVGREHTQIVHVLSNIGNVLSDQCKYSEALAKFEEALAIHERLVGREHTQIATLLHSIGHVLQEQGRYSEALEKLEESVAIAERIVGREHEIVALSLSSIGSALSEEGKNSEALNKFKEALAIEERLVGREHGRVAASLSNIGTVLLAQCKYSEALENHEESLAIIERLYGREHMRVAKSLSQIGNILAVQGKYSGALEKFAASLDISDRLFGREHMDVSETITNIGSVLAKQGKYLDALGKFEESLGIIERLVGRENIQFSQALADISSVLLVQKKFPEAMEKLNESLGITKRLMGQEHMQFASTLKIIGTVLFDQGKYSEALAKYEDCLSIMERLVGREHVEVAVSLARIGRVLQRQMKFSEAQEKYEECLGIFERLLGREHRSVATTLMAMSLVLFEQNKPTEALEKFEESLRIREKLEAGGGAPFLGNLPTALSNMHLWASSLLTRKRLMPIRRECMDVSRTIAHQRCGTRRRWKNMRRLWGTAKCCLGRRTWMWLRRCRASVRVGVRGHT